MVLSPRVSRALVVAAGCATLGLTGLGWYVRSFVGDPLRVVRGEDGTVRLVTRAELLATRLAAAEARVAAGDAAAAAAVASWRRNASIEAPTSHPPRV